MQKRIYFIAGCLFVMIFTLSATVYADVEQIGEVISGAVNLVVNGIPLDQEALLYNSTTYIPLRAAAEILGKDVTWDGDTNTVYIDDTVTSNQASASDQDLEKLNINTESIPGYAGDNGRYTVFRQEELYRKKPWRAETEIRTLPVYANPIGYDIAGDPIKGVLSADEMKETVRAIASSLGLEISGGIAVEPPTDWTSGGYLHMLQEPPIRAETNLGSTRITVESTGAITIWFMEGMPLPEGYSFTYYDTSEQQAEETMAYLLKQYAPIVNMEEPVLDLFGEYDGYAQRHLQYEAYENKGSLVDQILGDSFNRITFSPNANGDLSVIRRSSDYLLTQKIGDYPIITLDEARARLYKNQFISLSGSIKNLEEHPISHVELTYQFAWGDTLFTPFYKFFVETTDFWMVGRRVNGVRTFCTYFVPAIRDEYILNMPQAER